MFNQKYPFSLPRLPYAYDALEPYIDALTMEIHYTKHHQTYIDKLNKALEAHPDLQKKTLDELLKNLNSLPESVRTEVENQGGGHLNHSMFWTMMKKNGKEQAKGKVAAAITEKFGTYDAFKDQFTNAAKSRFGSGWAWLSINKAGDLEVSSTANQDTPLSEGASPILGLDVWEHAYYLKYQYKRPEYIDAWWHVVNWEQVEENLEKGGFNK
jgi:Fe-Mn family superoxide dismutase